MYIVDAHIMTTRIAILSIILLLGSSRACSQADGKRTLTLQEIFSLADTQSKTIKIYKAAAEAADKDISTARNAYLPNVDFSASATYNGNAWVADRDFSNGQSYSSPHFGNSFSIEATQVVFAGGTIYHNIKALEVQKRIAEWNLAAHRQETYFLLAGFYLDLYKYRNLLTVYEHNIEETKQVIRDMRAREAAGIVLNNDITRYEAQLQNLEYQRTELKSSISICNDRLVTMLDLPPETQILPDTALLSAETGKVAEKDMQLLAFAKAPLLNISRLSLDVLDRRLKVAKGSYLPRISIMAGDNLKGPITYEIPVLNANINTWYFGIGLTYSIGSLYKTPKETSRIRASIAQGRHELAEAEEKTELDVRAAYIRYLDSFELLKTQEKSLQLARENYDVTANRYANDLVLVIDLVDADNLRLSAEVQYVNAQINIVYNYCKLLYAAGTLNETSKQMRQ